MGTRMFEITVDSSIKKTQINLAIYRNNNQMQWNYYFAGQEGHPINYRSSVNFVELQFLKEAMIQWDLPFRFLR